MKKLIVGIIVCMFLSGCTIAPITPDQKWKVVEQTVLLDQDGEIVGGQVKLAPAVPFNFWSVLFKIGVRAGGL